MHLFYCPQSDLSSKRAIIDDKDELHHLRKVLRLKAGDTVHVFDGKGVEASGVLENISSRQAEVELSDIKTADPQIPRLILACAIPKKSKFEMIIEKATELGVDEIIPMITERTEIKISEGRENKKHLRFQTVSLNAAKQSKRPFIPIIHPITQFSKVLDDLTSTSTCVIPSLQEQSQDILKALSDIKSPKSIAIFIGPEGDFTDDEYALAEANGCLPVTLGATVLKVETAAICALSCAHCFFHA